MLILTLRTDNPEAEIGLFEGDKQLSYIVWEAGRELSTTMHQKIEDIIQAQGKRYTDVEGIVVFQGPGSFTGLRIGVTIADTLAYSLIVPIVATMGEDWITAGIQRLHAGADDRIALPHYGAPVHITAPKH